MQTGSHTFLDTDLHIHRLSSDPNIRSAAQSEFRNSIPTAMSAFSLVELKGNYIQCLILLRRKVADSNSLELAYSRAHNSGGRRASLMLAQLIKWLGGITFSPNPWKEARTILLTHLDTQISASWQSFRRSVSIIVDDFHCNRASEAPQNIAGNWSASIPACNKNNTTCTIVSFMKRYHEELKKLVDSLASHGQKLKTKELDHIQKIAGQTINKNQFPWEGRTCRQVGDLLIGLQSKSGRELLSSNYKEHGQMHKPLDYVFRHFPIAQIRSK